MQTSLIKSPSLRKGFSLVELIIVVVIIGVLSSVAFVAVQRTQVRTNNNRMLDDLVAIANAMEQYKMDHFGKYPSLSDKVDTNMNINCYESDATYAHEASTAAFCQGMIDNSVLGRRYLSQVPTDPRTGSRYVYGVTKDGKFFQVAGLFEEEDGTFTSRTVENLAKGFDLPSLVRAYNGPNFVVNRGEFHPYSPDHQVLTAQLQNINGQVEVNNGEKPNTEVLHEGDRIATAIDGTAELYYSDGSITFLDIETDLELKNMQVPINDGDNLVSKILIQLHAGKIWNKIVRLADGSEFNVETTGSIAGVRGTEFAITANGTIEVESGEVWTTDNKQLVVAEIDEGEWNLDALIVANASAFEDKDVTNSPVADINEPLYQQAFSTNELRNIHRPKLASVQGMQVTLEPINWLNPERNIAFDRIVMDRVEMIQVDGQTIPNFTRAQVWNAGDYTVVEGQYLLNVTAANTKDPKTNVIRNVVFRYEKNNANEVNHKLTAPSHPPVQITAATQLSAEDLTITPEQDGPQIILSGGTELLIGGDNVNVSATLINFDFDQEEATVDSTVLGSCTVAGPSGAFPEAGVVYTVAPPTEPTACNLQVTATIPNLGPVVAEWEFTVIDTTGAQVDPAEGINQPPVANFVFEYTNGSEVIPFGNSQNSITVTPQELTNIALTAKSTSVDAEGDTMLYEWVGGSGTPADSTELTVLPDTQSGSNQVFNVTLKVDDGAITDNSPQVTKSFTINVSSNACTNLPAEGASWFVDDNGTPVDTSDDIQHGTSPNCQWTCNSPEFVQEGTGAAATCIAADTTAPAPIATNPFSPANNATSILTSLTNATLTFDEDIVIADPTKITIGGNQATASASGAILSITLPTLFTSSSYTIAIGDGAIKDAAGNAYTGVANWTFNTAQSLLAQNCTGTGKYLVGEGTATEACWVLGTTDGSTYSDSCDVACNTLDNSAAGLDASCIGGDLTTDNTNTICASLVSPITATNGSPSSNSVAPYFWPLLQQCIASGSTNDGFDQNTQTDCALGGSFDQSGQTVYTNRICKCQVQ